MPELNPRHEAALRSADRLKSLLADAENARPVPFGQQRVDMRTWRKHFNDAPPDVRKQMMTDLGADRQERLAALAKRLRGHDTGSVPFGKV